MFPDEISYLDHGEERLSVGLVHQAVGEDAVDLVHPQTSQLLGACETHRGFLRL